MKHDFILYTLHVYDILSTMICKYFLTINYHIYYFFITTLLKNNSIKNALNENILRIRIFTAIF